MYDQGQRIYQTVNDDGSGTGICAAISMAYCADFLAGKRGQATQRTGQAFDLVKSYFGESVAAAKAAADMANHPRMNAPPEYTDDVFTYQDRHLALIFRLNPINPNSFPANALFGYIPPVNGAWYVGHSQKLDGQGGHAIAVSTGATQAEIYVLDPNYGLYLYTSKEAYTKDLTLAFSGYLKQMWTRVSFTRF
jgi:hypothetical protein